MRSYKIFTTVALGIALVFSMLMLSGCLQDQMDGTAHSLGALTQQEFQKLPGNPTVINPEMTMSFKVNQPAENLLKISELANQYKIEINIDKKRSLAQLLDELPSLVANYQDPQSIPKSFTYYMRTTKANTYVKISINLVLKDAPQSNVASSMPSSSTRAAPSPQILVNINK